jgi:hypothetical protein
MVERRAGGESGVSSVRYLSGPAVWEAGARGEWSRELAERALATIGGGADGRGDGGAGGGGYGSEARPKGRMEDDCAAPFAVLLTYADGFRATVLFLNGYITMLACAPTPHPPSTHAPTLPRAYARKVIGGPKRCRLPVHFCGKTVQNAEVGPTSGPTWRLSHSSRGSYAVGIADATRLRGGAVEACEFFLPGGPAGRAGAGEVQTRRPRLSPGCTWLL